MLTIDRITTKIGAEERVVHGMGGYLVTKDGTIYAIHYKFYHGIACAILFPELAKEYGIEPPVVPHSDNDVYEYQRFELDMASKLPVLRVGFGPFGEHFYVSGEEAPATEEQINAILRLARFCGLIARSRVTIFSGETTLAKVVDVLRSGKALYDAG